MDTSSKFVLVCTIVVIFIVVFSGFQELVLNPINEYFFNNEKEKVVIDLTKPDITSYIRANLTSYYGNKTSFSYEDIHQWVNEYLTFVETFNETERSNDPRVILTTGIGKCQEYSILFASACISIDKEARILNVAKRDFTDFPHAFNFDEPLPAGLDGQSVMVPGPGENGVDAKGKRLDRDKFTRMLKEYYQLRGWN